MNKYINHSKQNAEKNQKKKNCGYFMKLNRRRENQTLTIYINFHKTTMT